jgi:hypothetical protein
MRPITVTVGPLVAASANAICLSQTPSAGALTLNGALASGGVATLDTARRVRITCTGNESAKTFTITGTSWSGGSQSEILAGANASTSQSVLDYKTVTSITISATAANALTVGTNTVASSPWVAFDSWAMPMTAIQCTVSGLANYTVQQTLDDPNSLISPVAAALVSWVNHPDNTLVGASTTVQGNYGYAPVFAKVTLNSGTGVVTATFSQASVVPS